MKMTKELVSAIKRKDVKLLTGAILRSEDLHDEADEIENAGRLTVALIDRTCVATDIEEVEEVTDEESNIAHEASIDAQEPEVDPNEDGFEDVRKAIKKGKGKKAIKLVKAHKKNGARGSVLSKLLAEAKEL